jgi:FtsP/CotA-like multicopper oxidase with cupredoxin domain
MFWYHSHAHGEQGGRVGFQSYAGLAGLLIIEDDEERKLKLPAGQNELNLVLQDRTFSSSNELIYLESGMGAMMERMRGFLGDRILVNGVPPTSQKVATRPYRVRVLNGSNSRIYKLAWSDGRPVTVIGADGGPLQEPEEKPYVVLAPAQRLDIWLDLSQASPGATLELISDSYEAGMMSDTMMDSGMMGGMGGGMGGGGPGGMGGSGPGGMGGMMADRRPEYAGLLMNGRLPENPRTFDVQEGERVRFRFINASSATAFEVQVADHPLTVTHADGRPIEPVTVDSFVFGSGERYDAIIDAENPGTWEMRAAAIDGNESPAAAVLTYEGSNESQSPTAPSSDGRQLSYGDLQALSSLEGIDGEPDRTFDLTLSASRESDAWLIDGQAYPDADSLSVRDGKHVRVRMVNHSPVLHPMHLHGHFFQVGDAVKDTVIVPGHMGEVTFDFVADNPGDWLFHCHNLYHFEAGMARLIQYTE